MIIIALTDIHYNLNCIDNLAHELSAADLVLLTGDITHFGGKKEARDVVYTIKKHAKFLLAVPGNCDFQEVGGYLDENRINLHGRIQFFNDLAFIGIGGSLPCPGHTPCEYNERQFEAILNNSARDFNEDCPLVLVSHQPPYNTINDLVSIGKHVGSTAIRAFIERFEPLVCFTGHIHEGVGIDKVKKCKIVNPGPAREGGYAYFEINNRNQLLEIRGRKQ
jgi:Icc-related predicted phosphoesterase